MKKLVPIILLIVANLIYGINYSVAKEVMPEYIKPYGFVLLRCMAAMLFFWGISFFYKDAYTQKIAKKDYLTLLGCALFGVCINQLNFFKGLELTRPISASILMITVPILVMILSFIVLKNPITKNKLTGILIGMIGAVIIIVSQKHQVKDAPNPIVGNILVFINASSYAMYLILAKPLLQKYHPILVLKWLISRSLKSSAFMIYSPIKF